MVKLTQNPGKFLERILEPSDRQANRHAHGLALKAVRCTLVAESREVLLSCWTQASGGDPQTLVETIEKQEQEHGRTHRNEL